MDTQEILNKINENYLANISIGNTQEMIAAWQISPNPFINQLRVYVVSQQENLSIITIKNILGNEVFNLSKNIIQGKQVITINELDLLPNGIYILQLQCGKQTIRQRIIKQQ